MIFLFYYNMFGYIIYFDNKFFFSVSGVLEIKILFCYYWGVREEKIIEDLNI